MFNINDVCLILQGYSFSKEQLLNDVKKYYEEDKITKIIISSYTNSVDDENKKYSKILYNDLIGNIITNENKDELNKLNIFTYNNDEIIEDLNINNFNWDIFDNHYAEKNIFRMCTTSRRGIELAKKEFPNCTHYFVLRADMTLNNLSYLLNKWSLLNMNINDNIFNEKIVLKYAYEHEEIYNTVAYLAFGNKYDIEKYFCIKKAFVPNCWEKGMPERIISRSYIYSINPNISNKDIYEIYYYHEKEMNITWYKYLHLYNLDGLWGNLKDDYIK